jgi:hypothetical protein
LFGISGAEDALYAVDRETAEATFLTSLTIDARATGLEFFGGALYLAVVEENTFKRSVGTLDPETGAYEPLIMLPPAPGGAATALAIIPEPSGAPWYVDDDAPNDPGPGDPLVSDPLEDGSAEHPFDAIQEGINAAVDGDTVLVLDGTYIGTDNKNLDFGGKVISVRSWNGSDTCIIDCQHDGRGFYFHSGEMADAVLDGFTITNAYLVDAHGGAVHCYGSSPTIMNCVFVGNTVEGEYTRGPGVYCELGGLTLMNCLIAGNTAGGGGAGAFITGSNPTITGCTITANTATNRGAGLNIVRGSNVTIANTILSGNQAPLGPQINIQGSANPSTLTISYSNVEGGQAEMYVNPDCTLNWGPGNIDADPLFVDPDGPDDDPNTFEDNNCRLSAGSPCIDAADNEAVPADTFDMDGDGDTDELIPFDLDDNPRFVDDPDTDDTGNGMPPIVDMGAYEFQISIAAYLDIKPGSCPNPLNRNSHGVLPVAVVGTAESDVTQIDVDTLALMRADGVGGSVPPLMGPPGPGIRVEDVATPFDGEPCDCHELGGDGIDDLSMKFDTEAVVTELELNDLPGGASVELVVSGELSDSTPFSASDCIRLVPPGSGSESRLSSLEADAQGRSMDAQDASDVPLTACGALPPALLLTTLAGMCVLRCPRH